MPLRSRCTRQPRRPARWVMIERGTAYRLESGLGRLIAGVLICGKSAIKLIQGRQSTGRTRMGGDGELAVGLLDLELGGRGRDPEEVVVGGIDDHGWQRRER